MDNTIKPSASNVEKFLLAQQDPHNWSEKIWASYEEDAKELHDLMLKKFHTDAQRDAQVTACAEEIGRQAGIAITEHDLEEGTK
jgi:hypothetical protein